MRLAFWLVMLAFLLGSGPASAAAHKRLRQSATAPQAQTEKSAKSDQAEKGATIEKKEQFARVKRRAGHRTAVKHERLAKRISTLPPPRPKSAPKPAFVPPLPKSAPGAKITPATPAAKSEVTATVAALPMPRPTPKAAPAAKPTLPEKIAALPPTPPKADVTTESKDGVFAGIPADERRKIEAALLWAGDQHDADKGEDPMLAAVKSYQKRSKNKVTGVLTRDERAILVSAAERYQREYGWSIVTDPATGIRIGLPNKMVPHPHPEANGTLWSSKHGDVKIETFRIKGSSLSDVYEQERKKPHRKVEFNNLTDNSFHISGMQGLKFFSVRARARDGEVRGFAMMYDQMMETIVEPVAVAMAHAFTPFPARSAPLAALGKSVEYGTGLIVSPHGHIVTDRRITEACRVIIVPGIGNAERIAADEDDGIALLRVYGERKLDPLPLADGAPTARDVRLIGIADPQAQNGGAKISEVKARLAGGSAVELRRSVPLAGFSGAAALDAQGRVLGMLEMRTVMLASVKPAVPPIRLVSSATLRRFLTAHHVAMAASQSGDAKASLVRVICVRK